MSGVQLHFLNVGSGDCTIVHFPPRTRKDNKEKSERIMMVDMNHHEDHEEYEHLVDYYRANFTDGCGNAKPVVANADAPVVLAAGQFATTGRAGVVRECLNRRTGAVVNLGREPREVFLRTAFEQNAVHGYLPLRSAR